VEVNRKDMKKKLIEVALPLEAINKASAKEKSIRHAHPSTLHFWRSRKPLATCRAVLFASLVDDPSCHPERFPTEGEQDRERQRLFRLVEEFVKWELKKRSFDRQAAIRLRFVIRFAAAARFLWKLSGLGWRLSPAI
jgi:adenine-specific DNA methylase